MIVFWLMMLCGLAAKFTPETPLGRQSHRWLVEAPARWLSAVSLPKLVFALALLAALCTFGMAFAGELALVAAIDVATYAEIVAALWIAASRIRVATTARLVVSAVLGPMRFWRGRAPRAHRLSRRRRPPSPDDEPVWPTLAMA
jgi:hypothetical protein